MPLLPPGPTPWPLVGNLPELFTKKPVFRWILGLLEELNTEIACIKLGNVHVIPVISPEIAREFLKKHDAVFASRPITMTSDHLSRGFLTTVLSPWGEQWKKMRRIITSEVLKPARHMWLLQKRTEEADNLVRFIYNQCKFSSITSHNFTESSVVNVRNAVRQYTGNVVRKMMFSRRYFGEGRKDGGPGLEEEEHVNSLFTTLAYLYVFSPSDYLPCLRVFDLDGHEKMELMIEIVDNPAHAAEWAMAEMINQPEIMQKAGSSAASPHSTIQRAHVSTADAVVAGYFIPKGSHVLLSRVGLGRNPRVWEEPLKFKPERHMNDEVVDLAEPELRFISFSTGRRGCPGTALGTALTVTLLARLLQCFSWSVPPNEDQIDLTESMNDLFLAKPLHAHAKPRLHASMYGN
ncbi:Phenylalanine N-monooxygenase [Vitis vinifera]|uniref:Phenylalanine N-monooxygenase n=1 Tax=Vitis vinifera TaxID=29760 RepID=A0A438J2N2_VITVI|nr:Phenylalanine N-monooxygenase [Vitis vinifera]